MFHRLFKLNYGLLLHSSLEWGLYCKKLHLITQIMNTFFRWSHN